MNEREAIEASALGIAYRVKDDGLLLYSVGNQAARNEWVGCPRSGYHTMTGKGGLRRFAGVTMRVHEDWKPLARATEPWVIFVNGGGHVADEDPHTGWTAAIGASPVNVAMRRGKDGLLMIRRSKDRTWSHVPQLNCMVRLRQGFRNYSDWEPMPADHRLARSPWNEEKIPYREAKFLPSGIPSDQAEEWVATGDCPALREHRRKTEEEVRAHNEAVRGRTTIPLTERLKDRAELIRTAKGNPPCRELDLSTLQEMAAGIVIDEPAPEVLQNIGTMTEALASACKSMVEIGENDTAKELAIQLKHLVGNASWLLRNDRTERARKRTSDG